eukprot:TRINITY_DN60006_c0_g1_i1.p2 TRINITY_DN60006_c0_g1~~TRINITY_DN60006_c0_g1_i1.p2  ORF type:complete len:195 (+),score=84.36 TRINITY_DN60006_c0_g1_i1:43-585(+)
MGSFFSMFSFAGSRETKILMVGLDNAGKTTLLYKMSLDQVCQTTPTIGFNLETVEYRNLKMVIRDVGGQDKLRSLWKQYFEEADCVIFVVDSADTDRIPLAKEELHRLLSDSALQRAVVLVYANKQDLPGARSASDINQELCLPELQSKGFNVFVQPSVALEGQGMFEGLDFLANALEKK